mmetsp:Transcript_24079/g.75448  ORF Transcript_24079/g.75448 Transcript_24079/m.75448 type:complete len:263 (+) Transcript_24079:560-1348(+)
MPPFASSRNFICGTKYTNRALSLPAQAHSQPACQMLPFPACHTPPPEARSLRAAAGLAGREGPPLPWPDRAGLVHHGLARHPVLDLRRHGHESLLDVGGVLGGRLEEGDANLVGKRLSSLIVHHLLRREIALVPHQELVHVLVGVAVDLVEPLLDVVEALLVRHIIHHNNAVSPAVVAAGDCAEALLPGSIPNLQLDHLALELHGANFKVDADGGDVALCVGIIRETQQEARLSDAAVTDQQELEEIIILGVHAVLWLPSRG